MIEDKLELAQSIAKNAIGRASVEAILSDARAFESFVRGPITGD